MPRLQTKPCDVFLIQLIGRQDLNVGIELLAKFGFGIFAVIDRHIPDFGYAIILDPEGIAGGRRFLSGIWLLIHERDYVRF